MTSTTTDRGVTPSRLKKQPCPHTHRRLPLLPLALVVFAHCGQLADAFHRQLTAGELLYTFGVERHEHVPPYHLVHAQREQRTRHPSAGDGNDNEPANTRRLRFNAWNRTYVIELEPNHRLVSPHLSFIVRNGDSAVERRGIPPEWAGANCHYHGRVLSHAHVKAAISDCNGRLMGTIVEDDHFLVLQTIPHRMVRANASHPPHVIYRRDPQLLSEPREASGLHLLLKKKTTTSSILDHKHRRRKRAEPGFETPTDDGDVGDDEVGGASFCDVSNLLQLNYSLPSEANLDSLFVFPQLDPITLEIGLFLDAQLYEHFKREFTADPDQHLTDFSLALINNVHVLYQQPTLQPNLDIVIVRFEMWKKQPAPLATELHKNGQAQTLLDSFCRHQARINPGTDLTDPGHWDHAVLLTGYDIYHTTSSVAGVAPVGRMCDELFACSLVEGLHLGRSFVLAHEMGHNMGMVHDGVQNQCGRSCCLMSAVNGAGKTTWSTCSVREFNAFLVQLDDSGRGNCLRDPAEGLTSHNHLSDGRLPGQRFTADQQCSYFWGRDFQVEIPNGRTYDDICRILWCGNSGSTISTAHPALEGSWCGGTRWCHEGKCEDWALMPSYRGPTPSPVGGEWSDWSGAETQCPVSQCQVSGSITVRSQLRTCTNPAPNNGGRPCVGSSVRGLVCGSPPEARSRCEAFTRQEFGDRLCTAILHDPSRPDRSLSGVSFLHATQPCKVWCHVRDSELIRNKGQFPNGSPCGLDEYCVSGVCLRLGCNRHATVASEADCPPAKTTSNKKWESWTKWSECSTTCGNHGVQKRERKCKSPDGDCAGKSSELRECSPSPPPCPPEYGEWEAWSPCVSPSGKCSTWGRKKRVRRCLTSTEPRIAIGTSPCPLEKLGEEEECQTKNCPPPKWSEWGEWTPCSVGCGAGHRQRRRQCSESILERGIVGGRGGCEGESTEISACFEKPCGKDTTNSVVGEWSEWGPCSVTCGIGFQLRERRCAGGVCPTEHGKQARTCNVQDCSRVKDAPVWSEWGLWSACSHTCGQGIQERHRRCLNAFCRDAGREETAESKRCVLGPCPEWGEWGRWSSCATPCNPFESRRRQRQCTVRVGDGANGDEEVEVATEACQQRLAGLAAELDSCEKDCSKNDSSSPSSNSTAERGNNQGGRLSKWSEWSDWSPCSRSCGGGRQTRRRRCLAELIFLCEGSYAKEERPCNNTTPCQPDLPPPQNLNATALGYPEWSAWSDWSRCSCFSLTNYRRRYCRIVDPLLQGFCTGSLMEQRSCEPDNCQSELGGWSNWSEWSRCSRECGEESGYQVRNRMCSAPLPANGGSYCAGYSFDQRSCEPELRGQCASDAHKGAIVDGRWSEWQPWSSCSDKCINGQRSRTRYCSNPRPANGGRQCVGSDFEIEACASDQGADCSGAVGANNQSEALVVGNRTRSSHNLTEITTGVVGTRGWSPWSEWSNCSTDCGHSSKWRQRFCNATALNNTLTDALILTSTGNGTMNLNSSTPPSNLAYMTAVCEEVNKEHCNDSSTNASRHQWLEWSEWSTCAAALAGGKNDTDNSTVPGRFETCPLQGTHKRTRTRECITSPSPGHTNATLSCVGDSMESFSCPVKLGETSVNETSTACSTLQKNIQLAEAALLSALEERCA